MAGECLTELSYLDANATKALKDTKRESCGHSARKINYEPGKESAKESNSPFRDEFQPLVLPTNNVKTLIWKPSLKRSITWDPAFAPWITNRPRTSQRSIESKAPFTDPATFPSGNFNKLSSSKETYSEEILGPRSPCFKPVRPKLTTVDPSSSPLYSAEDGSSTAYSSLADSLKSPRLTARDPTYLATLNTECQLSLSRSRAQSSSSPFPRQEDAPLQWLCNASTAVASPSECEYASDSDFDSEDHTSDGKDHRIHLCHRLAGAVPESKLPTINEPVPYLDRPPGEEMVDLGESIWCHCVDCSPWRRGDVGKSRGTCLDARIIPRKNSAETVEEKMDWLARWLIVGLVGVWVLLMAANLELAGYEVPLESMH
ncbi:uncharacterized protein ColSpa_08275 [Colletotrichum spaethianum]|uniref:Uncharacterized protein n=1 Tax=Colletotrichum spaethianum TaxID=700344 RepID=A0AA37P9G6_9PEZI|nr:uncharacterized protein ColSpa_08275 [Colletotrichum spaethianum]GKT48094.1 hypothetical protein ColSpa_08275 [Colletotrichum spaethianum]